MNVLLISQCGKRALVESRRVLDQFAIRCGDRAWQTPITQAGLDTLRTMLRRTARKNTAVACHWIRGRDCSELLWIVGDASRFSCTGAIPTNRTASNVLKRRDEDDWNTGEDIRLIAELAALFHDFGKCNSAFQNKLRAPRALPVADPYRHEWVSLRLLEAYVKSEDDPLWLQRLSQCSSNDTSLCLERLQRDDLSAISPFAVRQLPPLAQAIGWLILSHHRLPKPSTTFNAAGLKHLLAPISPAWNDAQLDVSATVKSACWDFQAGLPFDSDSWRKRAHSVAKAFLARQSLLESASQLFSNPFVMHWARLILMLADHHYSSLPSRHDGQADFPLYANTDRETGRLSQTLDEHLCGVARHTSRIARSIPRLERELPRIARCKALQRRSEDERFRWQDKAYDCASALRGSVAEHGFFGVNMASTGCGKTLANARVISALASPILGARFTIALGLRTLTLQTGQAYRERLGLKGDELAVLVGGGAVRELFELGIREQRASLSGAESADELLFDGSYVHFDSALQDGPFKRWLGANRDADALLQAPILVCTIDHLISATESLRGGKQIAPILRLASSDLVLDEPDDFDLGDLPAVSRLVHWAGVFGSRVMLSSATLPPSLVQGLFEAYREGWKCFRSNRGRPGWNGTINCAWFDEFGARAEHVSDLASFVKQHSAFVDKRLTLLRQQDVRRAVQLVPVTSQSRDRALVCGALSERLPELILAQHTAHHSIDPLTHSRVSFGLVRLANIEPIILVATRLYELGIAADCHLHLCIYHARHPLLIRSAIERQLDEALRRVDPLRVFSCSSIRKALDSTDSADHMFVVLASPVSEVGRDHDYDWAIVEPSSMRSLIQLAGRVRRHRPGPCSQPNILVLDRNIRALCGEPIAYCQPGFENQDFRLKEHSLQSALTTEQLLHIDAGPRIRQREQLFPDVNLVDLEHSQLRRLLQGEGTSSTQYNVPHWWNTRAHLTGLLQASQRFRSGASDERYALIPSEDDDTKLRFYHCATWTPQGNLFKQVDIVQGPRVSCWGPRDYLEELQKLAGDLSLSIEDCARRYGTVQLTPEAQGWTYHPMLGFRRQG